MDEEPEFTTAADLRSEDADAESRSTCESRFAIPERPERRFPRHGGVKYEGGTVFVLRPERDRATPEVREVLEGVLADHDYRYGDWFDLPMPLFLVRDDGTNDVFRLSVRDGAVELHVRPETSAEGVRALYERLDAATDHGWSVDRRR
jgi:hypothetical protein